MGGGGGGGGGVKGWIEMSCNRSRFLPISDGLRIKRIAPLTPVFRAQDNKAGLHSTLLRTTRIVLLTVVNPRARAPCTAC